MSGYCPADGCPEVYFKHRTSFSTDFEREAFFRAMATIRKYMEGKLWNTIVGASPLKTDEQFATFAEEMKRSVPGSEDVLSIYTCKHGNILYQKSVRFKDVKDRAELAEKVRLALLSMSVDLKKEQNRPVESYFMEVE
jgi:hypothetical protein